MPGRWQSPRPAEELADAFGMDTAAVAQMLRAYSMQSGADVDAMTLPAFADWMLAAAAQSGTVPGTDLAGLKTAKALMDAAASGKSYTAAEMAGVFGAFAPELDENAVELLYLYHAAENDAGPAQRLSLNELFRYLSNELPCDARFAELLTEDLQEQLAAAQQALADGAGQLKGESHSLLLLNTTLPVEAAETTAFIRQLVSACDEGFSGEYHLVGESVLVYEMENSFEHELLLVTLLTALSIFLVVALTFRSLVIPVILVLIVQCGVYITVSVLGLQGASVNYLALLIVQCILMGATVDYGILYTSYYREMRRELAVPQALAAAYGGSLPTILTSGAILVLVTAIAGPFFGDPTSEQIISTLSIGCFAAILLIVLLLPGILAVLDRWVIEKRPAEKMAAD